MTKLGVTLTALVLAGCVRQAAIEANGNDRAGEGSTTSMQTEKVAGWDLAVTTSDGIAGRGLGEITLRSTGAAHVSDMVRSCDARPTAAQLAAIADDVMAAKPASWQDSYASPANPHGYADQIRTELTLTRTRSDGTAEKRSTFWYDENLDTMPPDLIALYDGAWKLREELVDGCR